MVFAFWKRLEEAMKITHAAVQWQAVFDYVDVSSKITATMVRRLDLTPL